MLALLAALAAAVYLMASLPAVTGANPLVAAGLVATGSAAALVTVAVASGALDMEAAADAGGWLALHGAVLVPVMVIAYVAALPRIGPTHAAIALTVEPGPPDPPDLATSEELRVLR